MALPVRIVLVAAAAGAVVVLGSWQRDEERCTDSLKTLFFELRDIAPDQQVDGTIESMEDRCPDSSRLVDAAAVLFRIGERGRAEGVIREAIRREPDSFSAWAGLASILRGSDPEEAAQAAERARRLNPRFRPPS